MTIKILLVEDVALMQMMAKLILSKLGYDVDLAENGNEAVEKCSQNNYDLIFMDIGLPDIDGIEATRQIRVNNQNIPIVALTAHSDEEKRKAAMAAGMNDYIVKPITLEKAQETLEKFVIN